MPPVSRSRSALALMSAVIVSLFFSSLAHAHSGPPSTSYPWRACKAWTVGGDASLTATVNGAPYSFEQYYVKLYTATNAWYGTATLNGASHPMLWIFPFSSHWFVSPAFVTGSTGRYGATINVTRGPGISSPIGVQLWAPHTCS